MLGADLGSVRVHSSPPARATAKRLGARAFTQRNHIWIGDGEQPDDVALMAHEAAHVVQQARTGRSDLQRWADPTMTSITPDELSTWSADDLIEGLELLLDQLSPVNRSVAPGDPEGSFDNMRLILATTVTQHVAIPDDLLVRLPLLYGPPDFDVATMYARLDLMHAMLSRDFPDEASTIIARLEPYRQLYMWLDASALQQADIDLNASIAALETAARIKRAARDPGVDIGVTSALGELNVALVDLLGALLTPALPVFVAHVEAARDAWLGQVVAAFSRTITNVRVQIGTPIDPHGFGLFSTGVDQVLSMSTTRLTVQEMASTIQGLEGIRAFVVDRLDRLNTAVPDATQTLEARLEFVARQSGVLEELIALAERVSLGIALCEEGRTLATALMDNYQINEENFRAWHGVMNALFHLVTTDYTRATMPALRSRVEAALRRADARVETIRHYERSVEWFVNIAATLFGIGAMRAVMALPAVAGLGRTGATIVGSLSFTGTRLVLTRNQGRPLTVGGVAEDVLKDYFLLRLLGGVDARIVARVGTAGAMATAARIGGTYATLVTWTLTWNALQPGPTGAQGSSTGDVAVHTGVDLAVLLIAEALLRAPAIPSTAMVARDPAARARVRREWEALRQEMETTGRQVREWLRGTREDVSVGDGLLIRATRLFARAKGLHARFAEIGEITGAEQAQLDVTADAMRESIQNARDEVRLGVRPVTAESWSYQGSIENVSTYLARLKTQGRVDAVIPEGKGVFSVRTPDGALHWFFPQGRGSAGPLDLAAEALEAAAPGVPAPTRTQAMVHLRGAGWADLGTFVGSLRPGTAAPFVVWTARPDTGAALASNRLTMPVVRQLAEGSAENLDAVARGDARHVVAWHEAWATRRPSAPPREFIEALNDIIGWRGSLEVSGAQEAGALLDRREHSVAPTAEQPQTAAPPQGPSIGSVRAPFSDAVARALQRERVRGAGYSEVQRGASNWLIERVDGRITRLLEVAPDGSIVARVDVTGQMAVLRDVLAKVGSAPDEVAIRTELARADQPLRDLDLLLDVRSGVPVDQIHLLTVLANHPLRALQFGQGMAPVTPPTPPSTAAPRRRRIVAPSPSTPTESLVEVDRPAPLKRRPRERESAFVDRVIAAQERAYWEAINGPAGRRRESPLRWARVQPTFARLVAAMRQMQARLQRAGRQDLLPEINDGVLQQPVDFFIQENPGLIQARLEIEARLREEAANEGRTVSESPEWQALQDFLQRGGQRKGARETMGEMRPDIVEFFLEEGRVHIWDVTIQDISPGSVHGFKTRVYVEIMRAILGQNGPAVFGQDIQIRTDITGERIDPARTRFGDLIE